MPILKNDRELLEALLRGEKIEKIRHAGFGSYIHLVDGNLINNEGSPANIYKITPSDTFQTLEEEEK